MSKIEEKIIGWVVRYFWVIFLIFGLIAAIVVRKPGIEFVADDYLVYLQPWYDILKENCGFKGLALDFYTYYIPYMCVLAIATYFEGIDLLLYIKTISICSEFLCALVGAMICYKLSSGENKKWAIVVGGVILFSPMIVLNGAFWGQCDYIYIFFILLSILLLLSEYYDLSFLMFGIAFAFKLQTIFLLPAYLLYYICNKKFSALKFLYIPAAYLIGGLPAVIAGRPAREVYSIYFGQANLFDQLSMNMPNIWRLFPNNEYESFYKWGIALTMFIFCMLAFVIFLNKWKLNGQTLLLVCLCSAGICVMFLPGMHERYTAIYCILAYIYFFIYDRKKILLAVVADIITTITYCSYLYGADILKHYSTLALYPLFAIINLGTLCYLIYNALQVFRKTCTEVENSRKI